MNRGEVRRFFRSCVWICSVLHGSLKLVFSFCFTSLQNFLRVVFHIIITRSQWVCCWEQQWCVLYHREQLHDILSCQEQLHHILSCQEQQHHILSPRTRPSLAGYHSLLCSLPVMSRHLHVSSLLCVTLFVWTCTCLRCLPVTSLKYRKSKKTTTNKPRGCDVGVKIDDGVIPFFLSSPT